MSTLHAALLGLIQGITEFLPISSSAHLVIAQNLFGLKEPELAFDVALHFGTLIAVIIYYFRDLLTITQHVVLRLLESIRRNNFSESYNSDFDFRLGICVVVATIPTVVLGLLFKPVFEEMFGSMRDTLIQLVINGGILWLSVIPYQMKKVGSRRIGFWSSILIGIAQAVAIIPGISRSGMTIVAAMMLGIAAEEALKFSFLLSIVSILGAGVLEFKHGIPSTSFTRFDIAFGSLISLCVGYLSIAWLLRVVKTGKLYQFANYCFVVGIAGLLLYYFHS